MRIAIHFPLRSRLKLGTVQMDSNNPARHLEEASMISPLEGKAIEKGAEIFIKHVAPKLIDRGRMFFSGRRFLILGPARSGKTSFLQYLEYLVLEPEKATAP